VNTIGIAFICILSAELQHTRYPCHTTDKLIVGLDDISIDMNWAK
jgi:hypothetical protein